MKLRTTIITRQN